jgi:hypothetical protein
MRKIIFVVFVSLLFSPFDALSVEQFLGLPVIPGSHITSKSDMKLELKVSLPHDTVLSYYKKALSGLKDVKFREWNNATYIEDDSNRPWHSITISKDNRTSNTSVVIMKDNWTWIIGTLILRFIGVFVVLLLLYVGMTVSGKIIDRFVRKMDSKKAAG